MMGLLLVISKSPATAGSRTRIDCLEGSHDSHYTTVATISTTHTESATTTTTNTHSQTNHACILTHTHTHTISFTPKTITNPTSPTLSDHLRLSRTNCPTAPTDTITYNVPTSAISSTLCTMCPAEIHHITTLPDQTTQSTIFHVHSLHRHQHVNYPVRRILLDEQSR